MVQTVTAAPVVSLLAACAYCPASTSFACLSCRTPMCPDCCPGDYCPDCTPAPVAPALDWSTERYSYFADVDVVACAGCDAPVANVDNADDVFCPRCTLPVATPPACLFCGNPIYRGDADDAGTRHPRCARFLAGLDARRDTRREDAIAA